MSADLATRVTQALRFPTSERDLKAVLADCWSEVRRLEAEYQGQRDQAERFGAQLSAAKAALGEGWLADGASLAQGITRKTRVLEGLEASAPVVLRLRAATEADRAAFDAANASEEARAWERAHVVMDERDDLRAQLAAAQAEVAGYRLGTESGDRLEAALAEAARHVEGLTANGCTTPTLRAYDAARAWLAARGGGR